jgi:hypothetical protein
VSDRSGENGRLLTAATVAAVVMLRACGAGGTELGTTSRGFARVADDAKVEASEAAGSLLHPEAAKAQWIPTSQ